MYIYYKESKRERERYIEIVCVCVCVCVRVGDEDIWRKVDRERARKTEFDLFNKTVFRVQQTKSMLDRERV